MKFNLFVLLFLSSLVHTTCTNTCNAGTALQPIPKGDGHRTSEKAVEFRIQPAKHRSGGGWNNIFYSYVVHKFSINRPIF